MEYTKLNCKGQKHHNDVKSCEITTLA